MSKKKEVRSSSGDKTRIHPYVVDGKRMYGAEGWMTSVIERSRDESIVRVVAIKPVQV